jgi:hypothetical protein
MRCMTCLVSGILATTLAILLDSGCSLANPTEPTVDTPATVTETFSGTFGQLGSVNHAFAVSAAGSITMRLTSVTPLTTLAIGVAIGSWDGTNCLNVNTKNDNAKSGATALSGTITPGNYCVRVYDSGNLPVASSVTYSIDVTHP